MTAWLAAVLAFSSGLIVGATGVVWATFTGEHRYEGTLPPPCGHHPPN